MTSTLLDATSLERRRPRNGLVKALQDGWTIDRSGLCHSPVL